MSGVWAALARTPEEARAAGVGFLLARQSDTGLWSDFQLAPGLSDEWITGYVGDRLAGVPGTESALDRAWAALTVRQAERGGHGWGYNVYVPQDADSTAWALRLAQHVGHGDDEVALDARSSLAAFRHGNGMLGTYGPTDDIARFIGADPDSDFRGWTAPHPCVTAAAAGLGDLIEPEVLLAAQRPDGRWRSYWWASDTFATALAVEALAATPKASEAITRAGQWAQESLASPALTSFEVANLGIVTALAGESDDSTVRRLTFTMLPDGSWPAGALLRVPHPHDTDPDAVIDWMPRGRIEGAVVEDLRRVFTTATVVHALTVPMR
ncbi:MAG: hypothetical protein ACKO70_01155 [Actinomycetota bacterium]